MEPSIIVIGAGGHARVILDTLRLLSANVLGVTDAHPEKIDERGISHPLLGDDSAISKHGKNEILLVNGIGSIQADSKRKDVFEKFKNKGYSFAKVIHPSAVIAQDAELGEGIQVMAGVVIQTGTMIGSNVIINTRASVDHDCRVGAHTHLAPGVILSGNVTIEEGCHIGIGAVVIQGVHIGKNSFVKAHSLVTHSIAQQ